MILENAIVDMEELQSSESRAVTVVVNDETMLQYAAHNVLTLLQDGVAQDIVYSSGFGG